MRICRLDLTKFRGIERGSVVFSEHSVLLGANNVGKSAVAEALALLFSRERMYQPLSDWDFFGGNPRPESRFTITATLTNFGNGSSNDPGSFPEWFGRKAATPVWWSPAAEEVFATTDPPENTQLAAQVSLAGRYDDEACDFELRRFFYDGSGDPFIDDCCPVSTDLLKSVGVFILPGAREWDKLLSFGSSTFMKVLKEYEAVPGLAIDSLKRDLRSGVTKVEESEPFATILKDAEQELSSFFFASDQFHLAYRPTGLDAISVLRSLVAFLERNVSGVDFLLPIARQGSGVISLQTLLLLLAFGKKRIERSRNFILIAEEPELHLHPALHRKLVSRIRAAAVQSVVTTHSPNIASGYRPDEVFFLHNDMGHLVSKRVRKEPIRHIGKNRIENLYVKFRSEFFEALMGPLILVPEGIFDYHWIRLWQRVAESSETAIDQYKLIPVCIIPTSDSAVAETYIEVAQFRQDAVPVVDGDTAGTEKINKILAGTPLPRRIIQFGADAGTEYVSAWILEPSLTKPGPALSALLPEASSRNLKHLQVTLSKREVKKDLELHENLAWESINTPGCLLRVAEFLQDVSLIASGGMPTNPAWVIVNPNPQTTVFKATHIKRA